MAIGTIARKELRLLIRDPRAAIVLLAMPFLFILVLGLSLGEGFGQKPDDRLRVSLVDLDEGYVEPATVAKETVGLFAWTPALGLAGGIDSGQLAALALVDARRAMRYPQESWAKVVQRDLADTAGIRVEMVPTEEEAQDLVHGKRSAILVFGPNFSKRVHQCSFLATGINPFYRDGVNLGELDARVYLDETQQTGASIIQQVAQVSLLRVILP